MDIVLPKNEDAERQLIGQTILSGEIPPDARDLSTVDFANHLLRGVWSAFLELDADGARIDVLNAVEILRRNKVDFKLSELMALTVGVIPNANAAAYVRKIRESAERRKLIRSLTDSIYDLASGKADVGDIKDRLKTVEAETRPTGNFVSFADIIENEVKPALERLRDGKTRKIPTGIESLDRALGGGISSSDIMMIAALTGIGKSAFATQIAFNLATEGYPVAFLSGEMSDVENGLRILTQASGAYNLNAATHLHADQYDHAMQWADHLKKLPIYFDSRTFDLRTLRRSLRSLVDTHGIQVLFIDYLQLFRVGDGRQSRTERIAETSQEVKRLAMEFHIAIVEVVQFNREGAKSGKPGLHDLEGSSQLEKDASVVTIIDREEDSHEITLRIVKGRNAPKSEIAGRFDGPALKFEIY